MIENFRKYLLILRNWSQRKSNQLSGEILDFEIVEKQPETHEYNLLRESVGWQVIKDEVISKSLSNSSYCICAYHDHNIIGMGRVVGDGVLVFYIQDMIIHPRYQGFHVGTKIMEKIMDYIHRSADLHASIGLMSARGREKFYAKFGFESRPNLRMGAGMMYSKDKEK